MNNASLTFYRKYTPSNTVDENLDMQLLGIPFVAVDGISKIWNEGYKSYFSAPGTINFEATINYPGLIIGSGYEYPSIVENDFELGFFFDHTTGLPVIPGSSVKGVLKAVFPKEEDPSKKKTAKLLYLNNILKELKISSTVEENNWQEIFFERRQVFFDAYISDFKPSLGAAKKDIRLFFDDYITHHNPQAAEDERRFMEPVPNRFLKIGPGVSFTFQFKLYDYKDKDGKVLLKADYIKEVFKQILIDFGIGAKRNVGYGQFTDIH